MTTTRRARIRTLAPFLLLPLLAGTCDRDPAAIEPPEDWRENLTPSDPDIRFLAADAMTGIDESRRLVLRNEADWLEVWLELWNRTTEPKPELPAVDFTTEMVVVATMGSRPSSGYAIGVDTVIEEPTRVLVSTFTVTPRDCFVLGVITAPAVAVAIPKTQKPVSFTNTAYVHDCE